MDMSWDDPSTTRQTAKWKGLWNDIEDVVDEQYAGLTIDWFVADQYASCHETQRTLNDIDSIHTFGLPSQIEIGARTSCETDWMSEWVDFNVPLDT